MADLSYLEKRRLEKFFGMSSGYVLDFSNRTFQEFILDSTGKDIYESKYNFGSGSKANRLRAFWAVEKNPVAGKLLADLLTYAVDLGVKQEEQPLLENCREIAQRLLKKEVIGPQTAKAPQAGEPIQDQPVRVKDGKAQTQDASHEGHRARHRLHIFLCHASGDKPAIRELYQNLKRDGFSPWLDEENLIPGQAWQSEIRVAVRSCDVVAVCLSRRSVTKEGYVQKEIRFALDVAEEKPEGTIFIIPVRIEDVEVPESLSKWHWVNLFENTGYQRLVGALRMRAEALDRLTNQYAGRV